MLPRDWPGNERDGGGPGVSHGAQGSAAFTPAFSPCPRWPSVVPSASAGHHAECSDALEFLVRVLDAHSVEIERGNKCPVALVSLGSMDGQWAPQLLRLAPETVACIRRPGGDFLRHMSGP